MTKFLHNQVARTILCWLTVVCLGLAPLVTPAVASARTPPPPQPDVAYYVIVLDGVPGSAPASSESPVIDMEALLAAVQALMPSISPVSPEEYFQAWEVTGSYAFPIPSPQDADGNPLPPPVAIPGPEGEPQPWKRIPGTGNRPDKWVPTEPIPQPGGGQPSGSWDPHGHWDVDNGAGKRTRFLPDGTIVGHDNVVIVPQPDVPPPFLDEGLQISWYTVGVVAVIIVIIIIAPEAAPIAVPLLLAPAAS